MSYLGEDCFSEHGLLKSGAFLGEVKLIDEKGNMGFVVHCPKVR